MKPKEKVNRLCVRIHDDEYTIKGQADSKHIEKVAAYVDLKMKQLSAKNPYLTPKKVAVLAAVNIADEYHRLKEDYETLIKLLDEHQQT